MFPQRGTSWFSRKFPRSVGSVNRDLLRVIMSDMADMFCGPGMANAAESALYIG